MYCRQYLAATCALAAWLAACGRTDTAPSAPGQAEAAPDKPAPSGSATSGPIGKDFGDLRRRVSRWFDGELSAGGGAVCSDQDKLQDPAGRVSFKDGLASTPRGELSALSNTSTLEAQVFGADDKLIGSLRVTDAAAERGFSVLLTRASGWSTGALEALNHNLIHGCVRDGAGQAAAPPLTATAAELLDGLAGSLQCSVVSLKDGKVEQRKQSFRFSQSKLGIGDLSIDLATATTAILLVENPTPDGATVSMTYTAELPGNRMVQVSRVNRRPIDALKLQWPRGEVAYECSPQE